MVMPLSLGRDRVRKVFSALGPLSPSSPMATYANDTVPGTTRFYLVRAGPAVAVVYAVYAWLTRPLYPNVAMWSTYAVVVGVSLILMLLVGSRTAVASSRRRTGDPLEIEADHLAFWGEPTPPSSVKERTVVMFSQILAVNPGGLSKPNVVWHEGKSPPHGLKGYRATLLTPENARMLRHAWENWKTGQDLPSLSGTPLPGTITYNLATSSGGTPHSLRLNVGRAIMVGMGLAVIALWPALVGPSRFLLWNGDALSLGMLFLGQGILTAIGVLIIWMFGVRMRQGAGILEVRDDGIRLLYSHGKVQWIPWASEGTLFTLKDGRKMPFHVGSGFMIETTASPETGIPEQAFETILQRATSKGCTVMRRVHTASDENGNKWGEWTSLTVER